MEIFIEKENKRVELNFEGEASGLLRKLNLNPEEVLITRNNEIITLDVKLKKNDKVKILSIISGG